MLNVQEEEELKAKQKIPVEEDVLEMSPDGSFDASTVPSMKATEQGIASPATVVACESAGEPESEDASKREKEEDTTPPRKYRISDVSKSYGIACFSSRQRRKDGKVRVDAISVGTHGQYSCTRQYQNQDALSGNPQQARQSGVERGG
jgi:hypothetical protein